MLYAPLLPSAGGGMKISFEKQVDRVRKGIQMIQDI